MTAVGERLHGSERAIDGSEALRDIHLSAPGARPRPAMKRQHDHAVTRVIPVNDWRADRIDVSLRAISNPSLRSKARWPA